MKTADLVAGPQADALVALAQDGDIKLSVNWPVVTLGPAYMLVYSPSTNPAQWVELIEVLVDFLTDYPVIQQFNKDTWGIYCPKWGDKNGDYVYAPTIGLAICKAVIAAKWGDTIPDEIWEKVK